MIRLFPCVLLGLALLGQDIPRDSKGRIVRHRAPIAEFRKSHPCPATGKTTGPCKGYVVDHKWPLCAGGKDSPENMQWQAKAESLIKDREEKRICRQLREWAQP